MHMKSIIGNTMVIVKDENLLVQYISIALKPILNIKIILSLVQEAALLYSIMLLLLFFIYYLLYLLLQLF